MSTADPRRLQLAAMREAAVAIGLTFSARMEQSGDAAEQDRCFDIFDRAFFGVRVSIALDMRLEREARAGRREEREAEREDLRDREPAETEGPERLEYTERDRDRDTEAASFPLLLKTLHGVAADAAAMPGPQPAELPALKDLLAKFSPPPCGEGPGVGVLARRPKMSSTRTTLFASALTPPPQPLPARGRSSVGTPGRATGPPKR